MLNPNDRNLIPADFNFLAEELPHNNIEIYTKVPKYKTYEITIWTNKLLEKAKPFLEDSNKYYKTYIDEIIKLDIHSEIKDDLAQGFLIGNYQAAPEEIQKMFRDRYKEILVGKEYIAKFETLINKLNK